MIHELWIDPEGLDTFCLAGEQGNAARKLLPEGARLEWTVNADSHFEAMSAYYSYRGYGAYTTDYPEIDKKPYACSSDNEF